MAVIVSSEKVNKIVKSHIKQAMLEIAGIYLRDVVRVIPGKYSGLEAMLASSDKKTHFTNVEGEALDIFMKVIDAVISELKAYDFGDITKPLDNNYSDTHSWVRKAITTTWIKVETFPESARLDAYVATHLHAQTENVPMSVKSQVGRDIATLIYVVLVMSLREDYLIQGASARKPTVSHRGVRQKIINLCEDTYPEKLVRIAE